jgi:GDP-L-fucose synthase
MDKESKIYVAGHTGLVGSAIVRKLREEKYSNLILKTHEELDLTRQENTEEFFEQEKPEYVFVAAATVGGVLINDKLPAKFMYENMMISANVIHAAYKVGVRKLLYMGSGCIYPRLADQPIKEESLLTGKVEKTNEAYALAKIAGVKMCEFYNKQYGTDFISCMPCNAYGPGDNFDENGSHVVPALIRKAHKAKLEQASSMIMWGTGSPIREFIYIDDIADACVFLMNHYSGNETINVGTGTEFTIKELTDKVNKVVGFEGSIEHDLTKPDGAPRKLLDSSKIFAMGWKPKVSFEEGIRRTYQDFLEHQDEYIK